MVRDEWAVQSEAAAGTNIKHKFAFDRITSDWRDVGFNDRMALRVQMNRNAFSRAGISERVLVMKFEHARLVIDLYDILFDEVAADDSIKVMTKPGRQSIEGQRQRHRLRESFQTRQSPGGPTHHRAGQLTAARPAHMDFAVQI